MTAKDLTSLYQKGYSDAVAAVTCGVTSVSHLTAVFCGEGKERHVRQDGPMTTEQVVMLRKLQRIWSEVYQAVRAGEGAFAINQRVAKGLAK